DGDQPVERVRRNAVLRPLRGGGEQRFLHRVLGDVDVAVVPHERDEHLRRRAPQQVDNTGVRDRTSSRRGPVPAGPELPHSTTRARGGVLALDVPERPERVTRSVLWHTFGRTGNEGSALYDRRRIF